MPPVRPRRPSLPLLAARLDLLALLPRLRLRVALVSWRGQSTRPEVGALGSGTSLGLALASPKESGDSERAGVQTARSAARCPLGLRGYVAPRLRSGTP